MAHDVFISYSTKDKVIADAVCAKLEQDRIRAWIAPRDVPAGSNFAQSIIRAINSCKVFVLIWSANTNASGHILNEVNQAFDQGITIVPFRIQDVQPTDEMRYYFGRTHWLDAITPPLEQHIATLRDVILVNLGRELEPEAAPAAPVPVQRQPAEKARPAGPPATAAPPKKREEKAAAPLAPSGRQADLKKYLPLGIGALVVLALGIGGVLLWRGKGDEPSVSTPTSLSAAASAPGSTGTAEVVPITVTSAEDSGPGTLRQALLDAEIGDTITFDAAAFPPESPVAIMLKSGLPSLKGDLTLDASNAGVILDGSQAGGDWTPGIEINSPGNVVKGLQIVGFTGPGMLLHPNARDNVLGGERGIGRGPLGEGNLLSGNSDGIVFEGGSDNVVTGNLIGTDVTGSSDLANLACGVCLEENASRNTIGPGNITAYNLGGGVEIRRPEAIGNTITGNSIHGNMAPGIFYNLGEDPAPYTYSSPPAILYFDLESGVVSGQTCANCIVEIFSTQTEDGQTYEGRVKATEFGNFTFEKGAALAGPFLTATDSPPGENTSEFSQPTASRSAIGMALDLIQTRAPIYQTDFSAWEFGEPDGDAKIEDGKLILTSVKGQRSSAFLSDHPSDKYALEFDFRLVTGSPGGHCGYEAGNDYDDADSRRRAFSVSFDVGGMAGLGHRESRDTFATLVARAYDETRSSTWTAIVLGDQIAEFIDGGPLYAILEPLGSAVYSHHGLMGGENVVCEFDNFKIWSLEGVDLDP